MHSLQDLLLAKRQQLHKLRSDAEDSNADCSNGNCPICYPRIDNNKLNNNLKTRKRGYVTSSGNSKVVKL